MRSASERFLQGTALSRSGLQMPSHGFVRAAAGGCIIDIEVLPLSSQSEIAGANEWRGTLQIKIQSAPERGRANGELLALLSEKLGLESSSVRVVKGTRSRRKKIFVELPPEEVLKRIGRVA